MATERGTVWVTRTEPGASRLAARLDSAGYRVVQQPLLRIEGCLDAGLSRLAQEAAAFDLIIAVSAHAVRFAMPLIVRHESEQGPGSGTAPDGPRWIAVGARTAQALAEFGVQAEVPEEESSEGILASAVPGEVSGRRVLLLCGVGGRQLLARELHRRGAEVVRFEAYRRVPATFTAPLTKELEAVDVALIASAEAGDALARLLPGPVERRLRVVAGSERIARELTGLGFTAVALAEGPGDDAMLAAVGRLLADGKS
jgi:uroporphyrinogen-III synthase